VLYVILIVTIGIMTLKKGHGWMFIFGFFLPLFWLIGALMAPTEEAERRANAGPGQGT
jgi:hypothetical protein